MKCTFNVIPALACFVLVSLASLCAADDMTNSTASWLPSDNQTVNCSPYSNCSGDLCHFKGTQGEILNRLIYPKDDVNINCISLKVELVYPTNNGSVAGNKTTTCFHYDNGNGTAFDAVEVVLTKPADVNGSQIICKWNNNNCTLQSETSNQIILVAGFPNNCTPWSAPAPTTPAPAETTTAATTTQSSSTSKSDNSTATTSTTTPVSVSTGPGSNTTGGTVAPTTQAPGSTTHSSGAGARWEIGMSIALTAALLICRYL